MSTLWMNEFAAVGAADVEAFGRGGQLPRRNASIYDRAGNAGQVSGSRRVLQVMVVDDKQHMAKATIRLVRRWGHAACVAHDRLSAHGLAAARNPDVVLLDMDMPHMDACQVARQLWLEFLRKDCLIIGIMKRIDEPRRQQSVAAGINLLLDKPADAAVVETLLMLECVRASRRCTDTAPNRVAVGLCEVVHQKPFFDGRKGDLRC